MTESFTSSKTPQTPSEQGILTPGEGGIREDPRKGSAPVPSRDMASPTFAEPCHGPEPLCPGCHLPALSADHLCGDCKEFGTPKQNGDRLHGPYCALCGACQECVEAGEQERICWDAEEPYGPHIWRAT